MPSRQKKLTRQMVRKLLDKWGLTKTMRPQISVELSRLELDEWWLVDFGRELQIDTWTLALWCRNRWIHARKLPGQCRLWVIWAVEEELERMKILFKCGRGKGMNSHSYRQELRLPKPKPPSNQTVTMQ